MSNYFLDVLYGTVVDGGAIEITAEPEEGRYVGPFKTESEAWHRLVSIRDAYYNTMYDDMLNPLLNLHRIAEKAIEDGSRDAFTLYAAVELRKVLLAGGQHEPFPARIKSARSK